MIRTSRLSHVITPASLFLCIFLVSICWAEKTTPQSHDVEISLEHYEADLRYLASDELEGRLPGTPGGLAATQYIADQFKAIGLKPAGESGTYFQPFTIEARKARHDLNAVFDVNGIRRDWKIGRDWIPLPFSKPDVFAGSLAFAGYGIRAAKFDYDDYAGFDAHGKILIILRQEPRSDDPQAEFGGETPSRHALFSKKASLAADQGAVGILMVNGADPAGEPDQLYPWYDWDSSQTYSLPIVHITRAVADALIIEGGLPNITELQERLDHDRKSLSADLKGLSAEIDTGLRYIEGRNVIGLLPGSGNTDETIVVGAHHDHVGNVPDDNGPANVPVIHNGADDNASGASGVIELARALAAGPALRRNILFMTFDGEEMGLLGSSYFVEHPVVPIENIRAMINLDMIGRLRQNQFVIYGAGSAKEFRELLDHANQQLKLTFKTPPANVDFFGCSDHHPFYLKNIPALFLFTNIHKQYHRPEDDADLIDFPGACEVLNLIRPVIAELADLTEGPAFIPAEQEEHSAEDTAEQHPDVDTNGDTDSNSDSSRNQQGDEVRVSLRMIPDHAYTKNDGVRVLSVIDKGPAQVAGMQDGDLIVRIGEDRITDIYSYMDALKQFEPDQTAAVVIKRGDSESTIQVVLDKARRGRRQTIDEPSK